MCELDYCTPWIEVFLQWNERTRDGDVLNRPGSGRMRLPLLSTLCVVWWFVLSDGLTALNTRRAAAGPARRKAPAIK
jgi:hypothetical protein